MERTELDLQTGQILADFFPGTDSKLNVMQILEGGLNTNIVFGVDDLTFVLRIPKPDPERLATIRALQEEYAGIGATEHGIDFRLRTPQEQANFLYATQAIGLLTVPCFGVKASALIVGFIDGMPLNEYVQQGTQDGTVIYKLLQQMSRAHDQGIVFGDRWVTNTIINLQGDPIELDFDIELIGDMVTIATFELSQTLYHLLHFSNMQRVNMAQTVLNLYEAYPQLLESYNFQKLRMFMEGQAQYFYKVYEEEGNSTHGIIPPSLGDISLFMDHLERIIAEDSFRRSYPA